MNEIDIRRSLFTDPRRLSDGERAAVESSATLTQLRDDLLRVDREMEEILRRPEVPDGLADRLVLRARYPRSFGWRAALAASFLVAALAVPLALRERSPSPVEQAMLEHVVTYAAEWDDDARVEPAVLRASVATLGVQVRTAGYRIRHLANCIVAGREGRHFVIDTPRGPVAFVILPAPEEAAGARVIVRMGGTQGVLMRRAGVAIGTFARDGTDPAALAELMRDVVA